MFLFIEWTPLMAAAEYGHLDIVKLLLNQEANLYDKNNGGKFLILYFLCRDKLFLTSYENIHLTTI